MEKINSIVLFGIIFLSSISYGQDTLMLSKTDLWQKVAAKIFELRLATMNSNQHRQITDNPTRYFYPT
jgi:Tfp pilus assembly protein PilV